MSQELTMRTKFPLELARLYESACLEGDPRLRVQLFVELYEHTLRHLALVGLAEYEAFGLQDAQVEACRQDLKRPSLGHWLALVRALDEVLTSEGFPLVTPRINTGYREGEIYDACAVLAPIAEIELPKKTRLSYFMDLVVQFRNKKIGHGTLTEAEARQVIEPFEGGLTAWLIGLRILQDFQLLFIQQVNYRGPGYRYEGRNINSGTSIYPVSMDGTKPIQPMQVYLKMPDEGEDCELIHLEPFFAFSSDKNLLYVYNELSKKEKPILRCPYESSPDEATLTLDVDASAILGGKSMPTTHPGSPIPPEPRPKPTPRRQAAQTDNKETLMMRSWYDIIIPHADIRKGEFDEAIFAADLGDVVSGTAPADYRDPYLFFKKTYPTQGLQNLLGRVQQTLSTGKGSSVVQIQTPFGGGKTHALVAIYHYLKNGEQIKELLPAGLELLSPNIAAIAGNHWDAVAGMKSDSLTRRTFWGELAFQIGGPAGYDKFRENDELRVSPGKDKLREFLSAYQPFIILFDEILEYINRARDVREQIDVSLGTQTFSFFQELTETVATIPQGMLVVTLPSSYLEDFSDREEESLARLNKIFGRVESIETPVQGEEIYAVIRRRLFEVEGLKTGKMREVVHNYFQLYQQHREDLPPKVRDANYRDKMELAYPFHPDVIDILYEKWGTFSTFQRTRGVLRLLANVIEDLYQREVPIEMILPGDINLDKPSIRQEFLKHIGPEYESIIASDIAGHEAKSQLLDSANKQWNHLAQCISTSIYYHSFSADDTGRGINLPYIKLAVLRSDTIPALVTDILGKLTNTLWYLNTRGDAYYFSRIPNLNRMILDKKDLFSESYEEELRSVIQKELGNRFRNYLWPDNSDGIPDNRELKLVILHPNDSVDRTSEWVERRGNSFREYKNTLFFAVADTAGFGKLREDVKTYLALEDIQGEIRSGTSPLPEEKQNEVQTRIRAITRDYSYQVRRMYHVVQFGDRSVDLGQPVTGSESIDGWFYRELTSSDLGAILTQLHYRTVMNKFLEANDQLATGVLLDQFYKNPDLPALSEPGVLARAIQLGVKDGALGLITHKDGVILKESLQFETDIPLDGIPFDQDTIILSQSVSELIKAELETSEIPPTTPPPTDGDKPPIVTPPGPVEPDVPEPRVTDNYKHVRLVIEGIPASKIADVNRGILMPFSRTVGDFQFTIEIDVSSVDGIAPNVLENQIKETIRQIGGRVVEEKVD